MQNEDLLKMIDELTKALQRLSGHGDPKLVELLTKQCSIAAGSLKFK